MLFFYINEDGCLVKCYPVIECGIPLEEIARKDTPPGTPFYFIKKDDTPADITYFSAWELQDADTPDGYGIGNKAWFAEQEQKRKALEEQSNG